MPNKHELFSALPKPYINDKILLITHDDLDAAGASVTTQLVFNNVDVLYCHVGDMDNIIYQNVSTEDSNYDFIIICDISCSKETADFINQSKWKDRLILIDHHKTAEWLNAYDWAIVKTNCPYDSKRINNYPEGKYLTLDLMASGSALLFDYFDYFNYYELTPVRDHLGILTTFIHFVSCWDTWEWHTILNDNPYPNDLNMLFRIYGMSEFVNTYINRIVDDPNNTDIHYAPEHIIIQEDTRLLLLEQRRINRHLQEIESKFHECTVTLNDKAYTAVFCYNDYQMPAVFAHMKNLYPNKDLYIMNFGYGVSLRAVRPEIDVSAIAKTYGGGGHPGAAGFTIPLNQQLTNLENILDAKIDKKE